MGFPIFVISSILILSVSTTIAQPWFRIYSCFDDKGNYTNNSSYQTNLKTLLSSITSNTDINYGFYNFSAGGDNSSDEQVNGIGFCRGDVALDACRSCLNDSSIKLTQLCPNQKEAIGWYDNCMLRYSNRSIFGIREDAPPGGFIYNTANVSEPEPFNQALGGLLGDLRSQASKGDSRRKFATGEAIFNNFQTVYALVQCTPDLSEQDCSNCLQGGINDIPGCCGGTKPAIIVWKPSCDVRYDLSQFYNTPPPPPPPPPPPADFTPPPLTNSSTPPGKKSNTSRTVIIIVVSTIASLILAVCMCIFLRAIKPRETIENVDEITTVESLQFDFSTIRIATDDFSDTNKLGQGGFGAVYKGRLSNGQDIAVKRLSVGSGQGDQEFKTEVLLVAKLQHKNLVRLQGFCLEGNEKLLVYEFVPNASLNYFIFDPAKRANLDWERRYKIIGGITRGLLYLHEDSRLRIIHRDLKAGNILLDAELNPKIADFGMARLFVVDQTQGNTKRIAGTYGYMAPEYAMHGNFSVKSDVYSFGVLILEIVSGQRNSRFQNGDNVEHLVSFAWKNWRKGTASNLIDPTLTASTTEIMRCIHIALLCVQENAAARPTMNSVALMLNGDSVTLPVPSRPAYFIHTSGVSRSDQSQRKSVHCSANDMSITELHPR